MLPKTSHRLFEIEVPSTKTKIKCRPAKYKEEKLLLMAKEGGDPYEILSAVKQIVNNCIMSTDVNFNKLTLFDIEFLFLKIRGQSIGTIIQNTYNDKEDGKSYTVDIDLDKVQVIIPETTNIINFDDITIKLKYPTVSLYANRSFWEGKTGADLTEDLIFACLDSIHQGDKVFPIKNEKKEDILNFLNDLPIPVYKQFQDFFDNLPYLSYKVEFENSKGTKREIELRTLNDFFILL